MFQAREDGVALVGAVPTLSLCPYRGVSAGYAGSHCEEDIAECHSSPCLSGGDCLELSWADLYGVIPGLPLAFRYDRAEGYICRCPPGFTGKGWVRGGHPAGPGWARAHRALGPAGPGQSWT